ncbi:hypothetical protein Fcan01_09589 [Folsomia candida]|uniref:Uncharacterized protein n=1 Tax=Folsomia candida TaxID=158441 RepID=A0A226EG49_FOLCA|nr:hypothetical protein Fcan01_09589 [Folsomia candida]
MLWISDATSALPGRRMSLQAGLILIHDNNSLAMMAFGFVVTQSIFLLVLVTVMVVACVAIPQNYFNTNAYIASQQRGEYDSYPQRPSVDPSAYYTGANRAKIARMLANYY